MPRATTCWSATPARSGSRARTCSRATGTTRKRRRAALTEDGWLRTGDVAVVDDDGQLFLVDRVKDLIIVSGFNVFPAEVEEVLLEHPAVEACGVIGVSHPYTGEAVKAYVVVVAGPVGRGGRADRVLRGAPRPVQVPGEGDVRGRAPARHHRQGPPPHVCNGRRGTAPATSRQHVRVTRRASESVSRQPRRCGRRGGGARWSAGSRRRAR